MTGGSGSPARIPRQAQGHAHLHRHRLRSRSSRPVADRDRGRGRGAFGRFKALLGRWPDELQRSIRLPEERQRGPAPAQATVGAENRLEAHRLVARRLGQPAAPARTPTADHLICATTARHRELDQPRRSTARALTREGMVGCSYVTPRPGGPWLSGRSWLEQVEDHAGRAVSWLAVPPHCCCQFDPVLAVDPSCAVEADFVVDWCCAVAFGSQHWSQL
jgi:hypothetical protein